MVGYRLPVITKRPHSLLPTKIRWLPQDTRSCLSRVRSQITALRQMSSRALQDCLGPRFLCPVVLPVPVRLPSSAWRQPIHQHHIHCPAHRKWDGGWRASHSPLKTQEPDISHPFSAGWPESDMTTPSSKGV